MAQDLDQSGHGYQRVRTYLGPSLGWTEEYVQPATEIKTGGVYNVQPGDSMILVNVAAAVTINLPDVRLWMRQNASQPATSFDRSVTVKDLGANATTFHIVIVPFGTQVIDNLNNPVTITVSSAIMRFTPLLDMSGWIMAIASISGINVGGDVFKAGNNTFTGTNDFQGQITALTQPVGDNDTSVATTAFVKNQNYLVSVSLLPYAPLLSPVFTGNPTAPTPAPGDNDTSLATTAFVQTALAAVGGGAPTDAEYIVATNHVGLTAERTFQDTATIVWDFTVPGKVRGNSLVAGGGNVSNSGNPTVGQYAQWVTATTIMGVPPSTVMNDIGAQPLDADLTAIAALTGTNTIYYRSAANIWSPVTFSNMSFSGGVLAPTVGGGNVSNSGTPVAGQIAVWTDATHIQGVAASGSAFVQKAGDTMTGDLTVNGGNVIIGGIAQPALRFDPSSGDTKQYSLSQLGDVVVESNGVSPLASLDLNTGIKNFTASPVAPTPTLGDNSTKLATTAFVLANAAPGAFTQVKVRVLTVSGTYTPTAGTKFMIIEGVGGGGGGGDAWNGTGTGNMSFWGGGGGSGAYARTAVSKAIFGASRVFTIGANGTGGGTGQAPGTNGSQTSMDSMIAANGGFGGSPSVYSIAQPLGGNAANLTGALGDFVSAGSPGQGGMYGAISNAQNSISGMGGSSHFGGGAVGTFGQPVNGVNATGFGSGGGGAVVHAVLSATSGGSGSPGVIIVTEFI